MRRDSIHRVAAGLVSAGSFAPIPTTVGATQGRPLGETNTTDKIQYSIAEPFMAPLKEVK